MPSSVGETVLRRNLSPQDKELYKAAEVGDLAAVKKLLGRGVKAQQTDGVGETPLFYAAWKGHAEVAALLLDRGAVLDAADKWLCTPLIYAASCGQLESKARKKRKGKKKISGRAACLQLLLDRGADAALRDKAKKTALDYARQYKQKECIALLRAHTDAGAEPDVSLLVPAEFGSPT